MLQLGNKIFLRLSRSSLRFSCGQNQSFEQTPLLKPRAPPLFQKKPRPSFVRDGVFRHSESFLILLGAANESHSLLRRFHEFRLISPKLGLFRNNFFEKSRILKGRGQMTEDRGQTTDYGRRRTEGGGQRTEGISRGPKAQG